MAKVTLKGYILVPDPELPIVQEELKNHIALTRQEEGCLIFEVNQDDTQKNKFHVYEVFSDEQAFNLHQQRVRNSHWGTVTANVERFYTITGLDN